MRPSRPVGSSDSTRWIPVPTEVGIRSHRGTHVSAERDGSDVLWIHRFRADDLRYRNSAPVTWNSDTRGRTRRRGPTRGAPRPCGTAVRFLGIGCSDDPWRTRARTHGGATTAACKGGARVCRTVASNTTGLLHRVRPATGAMTCDVGSEAGGPRSTVPTAHGAADLALIPIIPASSASNGIGRFRSVRGTATLTRQRGATVWFPRAPMPPRSRSFAASRWMSHPAARPRLRLRRRRRWSRHRGGPDCL